MGDGLVESRGSGHDGPDVGRVVLAVGGVTPPHLVDYPGDLRHWNKLDRTATQYQPLRYGLVVDEFLDTEWYEPWPEPPTPGHMLDPWRSNPSAVLIERSIIERLAKGERLVEIERFDVARIEMIAASIEEEGLREPLLVLVTDNGAIALKEGHHRLVATRRWEHFRSLPVVIRRGELKNHRPVRVAEVLLELLGGQ